MKRLLLALLFFVALVPAGQGIDPGLEDSDKVLRALIQGQTEEAESLARQILAEAGPAEKPAARNLLGMVLGQAGQYEQAILLFQENAEANPEDAAAFANWGEALRRAGRFEEALEPLQRTVELHPESTQYQLKLRLARLDAGEEEPLRSEIEEQLLETPVRSDWLLTAAAMELRHENWEEAKEMLRKARILLSPHVYGEILQDPAFARYADQPEVRQVFPRLTTAPMMGSLTQQSFEAYASDQPVVALDLLEQAEALGESLGPILTLRGAIFMGQERFEEAATAFELALVESPGDLSLYLNQGEALRGAGRPGEASTILQRGLLVDPGNEILGTKLAFALIESGQGADVYETGLKEARTGPLLIGRAAAAAHQGQLEEASELLQRAEESMPPQIFESLLQDPIFKPYREAEQLSGFFPQAD